MNGCIRANHENISFSVYKIVQGKSNLVRYGLEQKKWTQQKLPSNDSLSHELGSEWASKNVSAAERVSEASSTGWANEWAAQVSMWQSASGFLADLDYSVVLVIEIV